MSLAGGDSTGDGPATVRIAHAIYGLGLGGAQKVIASILRGRRDPRIRYFVYTCLDGVHRQEVEEAGATVRILPRVLPKIDPLQVWRLSRAMARDDIHLLHGHLFGDSLHGHLAARLRKTPMVLTLHIGPEGWNGLQRRAYPWLLGSVARSVACSESVQANVHKVFPKATRVMETISNGIERPAAAAAADPTPERRAELRRGLGVDDDAVVLATVGRLSEQKGLTYLISAMARRVREQPDTRARLVLLGEGELKEPLEAQARSEGVAEHVIFAGFRDNVGELLRVIDVVVFSSLYEGLPIALLEAMAAGRPLVCTDIPGNLDAVRDDREALVVRTADVDTLAEALARITTDGALRRRLGEGARQRFEEKFTATAMVGRYEALYRQVLGLSELGPSS